MIILEGLIWFIPWLTEAWLWEKSVHITISFALIFSSPRNWCVNYDSQGYEGVFYCM